MLNGAGLRVYGLLLGGSGLRLRDLFLDRSGLRLRVLILKALEAAFRVHHLVRAGVEGVAVGANVHAKIGNGATDLDFVTTVAGGGGVYVSRVDAGFHFTYLVYYKHRLKPGGLCLFWRLGKLRITQEQQVIARARAKSKCPANQRS
jgi:hypothetical protein